MEQFTTIYDDLQLPQFSSDRYKRETVATLKRMLEQRCLKKTGKKADLIYRLEAADMEGRDLPSVRE